MKLHKNCRACGSTSLIEYLNLGELPLANNLGKTKDESKEFEKYPLAVMFCDDCGLSQLSVVIDPKVMFSYYPYRSAVNMGYVNHCTEMAKSLQHKYGFDDKIFHIDIAGNDGTLLKQFKKVLNHRVLNVDPAENLVEISRKDGIAAVPSFWNSDLSRYLKGSMGSTDLITATNVFAHVDDIKDFIAACKINLKTDGILIIECPYIVDFIERFEFDTCFTPNTFIPKINKNIEDCKIGDIIYSSDGSDTEITHIFKRDYKGEILTLKPDYLEEIKCTPNHPILVSKDGGATKDFIDASKIEIGDYVCVPKLKSKKDTITLDLSEYNKLGSNWRRGLLSVDVNEDFAYLIGLYTADGSSSQDTLSIALAHHQRDTIGKKIINIINNLGNKVRVYDRSEYGSKCDTYNFSNVALLRLFKDKIGLKAHNKIVPEFILNSNKGIKESYLRGLLDGDGYYKDGQIHLHTASKTLALQIQLMFCEFNIMMGISYTPPRQYNILNGSGMTKGDYQLRAKSKIVRKFFKDEKITKFNKRYHFDDDYIYVKINDIKKDTYDGLVYNFETKSHTYTASNIAVHNCYHEHLSYMNIIAISRLCSIMDMKIISVEKQDIHGGTVRITITNEESTRPIEESVHVFINKEIELGYNEVDKYIQWGIDVKKIIDKFSKRINELKDSGKSISAFAASAKGNTLLNSAHINDSHIDYVVDQTPEKLGHYYSGTGIEIVDIKTIEEKPTDYLLILSWNFKKEIIEKLKPIYNGEFITYIDC